MRYSSKFFPVVTKSDLFCQKQRETTMKHLKDTLIVWNQPTEVTLSSSYEIALPCHPVG